MKLTEFNAAPRALAVDMLLTCVQIPAWAARVADARPYTNLDALVSAADTESQRWSDAEVDAALAGHPRIGERLDRDDDSAAHSAREQSGVATDSETQQALREANAAYEARFDRVFLIRAAGRTAPEILAEARRRLDNDDATERFEVATQLREITLRRLNKAITDAPVPTADGARVTTHVLDAATGSPASGVKVALATDGDVIAEAVTDDDGRIGALGPHDLSPGVYTLTFETGSWFAAREVSTFYPSITISFTLEPGRSHVHVPILLSPFAYSTYRGS